MAAKSNGRLGFGPQKYAALHLILGRWLRLYADRSKDYCYVTFGDTELRDIFSILFVDRNLARSVWSYETIAARFQLAKASAVELAGCGIRVNVQQATVFSHRRTSELPNIFFVDLEGICAWGDYDLRFADMFQNEIIREGDCLLITSHLGHNRGANAIRTHFSGEFAVLGIDDTNNKNIRNIFRRAHPTMTLFKALSKNGIQSELALRCFGIAKYRDGTPMGLYGYTVMPGKTDLKAFVKDDNIHYFDVNHGRVCEAETF